MAIFQVADFDELRDVRARVEGLGIRVVWATDLDDIATSHLHPKDVPGAIVSVDAAVPAASWRWAGPRWMGAAPADPYAAGGIAGITVEVDDPDAAAATWAAVLGCDLDPLPSGQSVRFVDGDRGIIDVDLDVSLDAPGEATIGSVTARARTREPG
jgi:hypothetical protein